MKKFAEDGKIIFIEVQNFWKDIRFEYYENGQIKESSKCRKFIGIKTNCSISKSYSKDGKLINKKKGKCRIFINSIVDFNAK